ncbi:MAG: iron-containing alcohol dehydrogenase [Candidatus Cloacimonetes bacterium]|nr:iron-containing alcohol dehydrogenase [Candidatus Cloacimonadota bacterium]
MDAFTFHNPTRIHFGAGMIRFLGKELKDISISRCLMIAGGGSIKHNGVYDQVCQTLASHDIKWTEGWGVVPNPILDKVRDLITLARQDKVEAIVAVGGGSVIDTAKAVAAGIFLDDVWTAFTRKEQIQQALPLFTVLTLSATGSEMNGNAVITHQELRHKSAIYSPLLYPRVSIIDPTVQSSLPFHQTVNGALDAIAHILEYYFVDEQPVVTLGIDDALQRTIVAMTDRLKIDPADVNARSNLAWSATLALNGISGIGLKGGDWACHQIEHAISAVYPKVAHGEGLGVIFPTWIEYLAEREPARFARWSLNVWGESRPEVAVKRFREKICSWDSAGCLRDLGVKDKDLPLIIDLIMQSSSIGAFSKFRRSDVEALLLLAY